MADDEIVPEGISDFLPHESHGDLSSFDIDDCLLERCIANEQISLWTDRGLSPRGRTFASRKNIYRNARRSALSAASNTRIAV